MNLFENMALRWKLGVGFAFPMTMIVVISVIVYISVNSLIKSADLVNETNTAIEFGTGLTVSMVNMETGLRGYLVAGKDEFLEPYVGNSDDFTGLILQAMEHVKNNPQQVARLGTIRTLQEQWISDHAEPAIEMRRDVNAGEEAAAAFKELSGRSIGNQKFDSLRAVLADLSSQFQAPNDMQGVGLVQSMLQDMMNQESSQRGFLLSGQDNVLAPFWSGGTEFQMHSQEVRDHVERAYDRNATNENIQAMQDIAISWQAEVADVGIELKRQVDAGQQPRSALNNFISLGSGKKYFDQARGHFATLDDAFLGSGDLPLTILLSQTFKAMLEMETGYRDFLLAGADASLTLFRDAEVKFTQSITELALSIQRAYDPDRVTAKLAEADRLAQEWVSQVAQPEIDARFIMNTVTSTLDDVTAFIEQGIGKDIMDEIRSVLDDYSAEERTLVTVRTAEAGQTASLTTTVIVAGSVTSVILCLLITFYITRNILGQLGGEPQEVDRIARDIADGNLSIELVTDGKSQQGVFASMVMMKARLTDVVREIKAAADSVKTGSTEISQGNATLSQRTEEQASSLEETASSMEQMTATVKQNADSAGEANQLAKEAREQAQNGGEVVGKAIQAMSEISASSKKIADIIGVIDEIAFQTNLLALNASVEAARAGEQGRGFAVVASEVRNLAGRSATAAKEIKELIQDSVTKVEEGGRLVGESGDTLTEIVNSVKKVTDIIGEIAAASHEQTTGIEEVNRAITQMDELTQQNAALVEEAAAASESMGEQAVKLNDSMTFFTVDQSAVSTQNRATASRTVPPGANQAGRSGGSERRDMDRPWVASDKPAIAEAKSGIAPSPGKVAKSGDADWKEF